MSKLGRYRKAELKVLAEELGIDVLASDKIIEIVKKIEGSADYDENFALDCLATIREENEIKQQREEKEIETRLLREEKEIEMRLLREEKEREEKEKERQHEETERIRAFELEKLRITHSSETRSETSETSTERRARESSMKSVMPKFVEESSDITLFLSLFERQARKLQIRESDYVMQLLALLPTEMTQLIVRETEADNDDFEAVKKILLERYRLSTEAFRIKYMSHQRGANTLWKDLVFELRTYLESWLAGAEISDFEGLKDLMIADQVKKRASPELRQHFVDDWGELNNPREVAEKFDKFELARKVQKKPVINKPPEKDYFKRNNSFGKADKGREKPKVETDQKNWRDKNNRDETERTEIFERRKKPACYECGSTFHMRYNCPELQKTETINNLEVMFDFHESFRPYVKIGKLYDEEMRFLRDSGSSMDVLARKYITEDKLNGEYVWIKQPLENQFTRLAVANVELEIDGVKLKTKAAVLNPGVIMNHYLLGNRTQEIIDKLKGDPKPQENINLGRTRKETMNIGGSEREKIRRVEKSNFSYHPRDLRGNETAVCLPIEGNGEELKRLDKKGEKVQVTRKRDSNLKGYGEKAEVKTNSEYEVGNNLLLMGKRYKESEGNDLNIDFSGDKGKEAELEDIFKVNDLGDKISEAELTQLKKVVDKHRAVFSNDSETKMKAIAEFPTPTTKKEIRKFIGMVSDYGRDIKNFAKIAEPLTRALRGKKKKRKVDWTSERANAFEKLKRKITEKLVLKAPNFSKPFDIATDASSKGIEVSLSQQDAEEQQHPSRYLSRKSTKAEENYFTTLQPYDYTVVHRPGSQIGHVDTLSRIH